MILARRPPKSISLEPWRSSMRVLPSLCLIVLAVLVSAFVSVAPAAAQGSTSDPTGGASPAPARPDPRDRRILELERENRSLAQSLAELQERVSTLLGIPLEPDAKN